MLLRSLELGWSYLRRPAVWLALMAWGVLTAIIHFWTPIEPVAQFDPFKASWELDKYGHEAGRFIPQYSVAGISTDGGRFMTAERVNYVMRLAGRDHCIRGPVRVWRLGDGKLLNEFATKDDDLDEIKFAPDGSWISMRRLRERELYVVDDGRKFTFDDDHGDLCCSSSGQWVAYRHKNTLERFYPRAETIQTILDVPVDDPKHNHRNIVHGNLHAVSHDDRWLAVEPQTEGGRRRVVLLDIEEGIIAAEVHLPQPIGTRKVGDHIWPTSISGVQIARDKRTLAIAFGLDFVVMDIATNEILVNLRHAKFLGWDRSQRNIIAYYNRYHWTGKSDDPSRLEVWNLDARECRHAWDAPEPARIPYPSNVHFVNPNPPAFVTYMRGTDQPILSPDGSRVVWLHYRHEKQGPEDSQGWIRSWFRQTPRSEYFYEARVLSTRDFSEESHWRFDAHFRCWSSRPPLASWTVFGDRLLLVDERVELWDVPPTSLSRQIGVALIGTWILCVLSYMINTWRLRRSQAWKAPQQTN